MKEEINLTETLLKNRWGRDQKIKPGDKVRIAPFKSRKQGNESQASDEFLNLMTEGLAADQDYTITRIVLFPDDGTVILFLDLGQGREEGYYAEYLQAVDQRKIKTVEFPFRNPKDVVKHLKTVTEKTCRIIHYRYKPDEAIREESQPANKWIILPAAEGRCKVTIEGEPREVKLNPEKVIVIPVPAGKRHSLLPVSGFCSYLALYEAGC